MAMTASNETFEGIADRAAELREVEVVLVGAGVSGLYAAYKLRQAGIPFQGLEAGDGVGGTWFWNRYPGCRCDSPSIEYSYGFDPEIEQEWCFTETMELQPRIEEYLNFVADRHDLRGHFHFSTKVLSAVYDETARRWTVETDRGDVYSARWCVMAIGALSAPNLPDIPGRDSFQGVLVHTGLWPRDGVELEGKRVGVIGTGSSGIQAIPKIAEVTEHLTVFQRTPGYAMPANVTPMDPEFEAAVKARYRDLRKLQRASKLGISGFVLNSGTQGAATQAVGEGALPDLTAFADPETNRKMRKTLAEMVRDRVRDPEVAEALIPKDYPFGCKRLVLETNYYETFNRENVRLLDLTKGGIIEITPSGVRTEQGDVELDVLVFATGYDALTGPATRIDIRGRGGRSLKEKWAEGPRSYLGLVSAGFPNMFFIHGPGSPSVLTNMITASETQVELITQIIEDLRARRIVEVNATAEAEDDWIDHVADVAEGTQYTAPDCRSWYLGANIQGKRRIFMPYLGGLGPYQETCEARVADNYRGFTLMPAG